MRYDYVVCIHGQEKLLHFRSGGDTVFGYIRTDTPELRVREHEFYRGTYCGLCRSMGKCTGQCSRMTLSYDFVFLAVVRLAMENTTVSFEQKRCLAHPLKKRNCMKDNPVLTYCAGAAALLSYHKVADDYADEKGWKKARAVLLKPFASHARKKALRSGLEALDAKIAEGLASLARTEKEKISSVDVPARIFGEILGEIVAFGLEGSNARIARTLGQTVGRWIYMADAFDDMEEDLEKGRYNPFLLLYGGKLPDDEARTSIANALKNELYGAETAMDLIAFENETEKNIVMNILYLGMPARIEEMICEKRQAKNKKEKKKRKDG